jgi:glycosyltransferase involved in cell wall biosynthesis
MKPVQSSHTEVADPACAKRGTHTDEFFIDPGSRDALSELSVIIPVYNEVTAIRKTVEELKSACPELEIIVVDDGSDDGTGDAVQDLHGIKVLYHSRNCGYGAALKTGMRSASRRYVAWYDGDGQHRPEDLLAVALPVITGEQDAVVGVRGQGSARQIDRVAGKALLTFVARFLVGQPIPDLNSGLRCFPVGLIRRYAHLLPNGFSASTTSTLCLVERGYRVGYVPIKARRREGQSKVRLISDGLGTLRLIFRLVVLFNALKVFTLLGLSLVIPGLIYGVIVALEKGAGFPTLAGTAIIAGLLTIFIGVVADQVTELRKERFEDSWD